MALPKRKFETGTDDVQTIDCDVDSLRKKFIEPIDAIRSFSKPGPVFSGKANEPFDGMDTSPVAPLESRCHAFLRFIGFPVATENGFYNPGFNPRGTGFIGALDGISEKQEKVNKEFSQAPFISAIADREQDARDKAAIFQRQDLNGSLYTLLLTATSGLRPFQIFQEGVGPFDVDKQSFTAYFRQFIANDFFSANHNLNASETTTLIGLMGAKYSDGRHILKPFVVDPRIDITVMPDTSRIAVPFLPDADSLLLDHNKPVKRPGIELIIRERLRKSSSEDDNYYQTIQKLANNEIGSNDLVNAQGGATISTRDLRSAAEAVLDDNEINSSSILELQGITTVQVKYITDLVKTLKCLISVLRDALETMSEVQDLINWVPIPSLGGPELGNGGAKLATTGTSNVLTTIDRRINSLKLQRFAAQRKITEEVDLGDFASPFSQTTNTADLSKFDKEIAELTAKRNKFADIGFRAMGRIETIVGEVSGLGLIDIISIYIALWAMKEESLINLLDEPSFQRLVDYFPDLVSGAASDRAGSVQSKITQSLQDFEDKLRNVFNFVDREFARQGLAPGEEEGGLISPDS
jgi:hypothetical protein